MLVYCKIWSDDKIDKVYECVVDDAELNTTVKNCAMKHGWSIIRTRCFTEPLNLYIDSLKLNAIDFQ